MGKKIFALVCTAMLLGSATVSADESLPIIIDGVTVTFDGVSAYKTDNYDIMLPIRAVCEYMGYNVEWIPEECAVDITSSDTNIRLYVGGTSCSYNGSERALSKSVVNNNGRTYLDYYNLIYMLDERYIAEYTTDENAVSIYQGNAYIITADGPLDWRGNVLTREELRTMVPTDYDVDNVMREVERLQRHEARKQSTE